ncbi:MAG: aminotransferase class V-fold PLP-dependent enzyme [Acetivibrionales bacterium]|jgi:cysteine desulfurase/selenocysteine lyase
MIYLDNAATSFPKPECVYTEMNRCMREYCSNPGRGSHSLSVKSGMAVMSARERICSLFNISDPMRIAFTKNATEALNMAIKGVASPGCHIITTCMEHNSVMRPLRTLVRDMGIRLSVVSGNWLGEIEPEDIRREIRRNTVLIVSTLSSNVNGAVMPINEIGQISREHGILFLVDASQGAGSMVLDVARHNIDMLAVPGHKGLMGPQGTGFLYVRNGVMLKTLMEGGTGSNSENVYQPEIMPDMLESGTLNTPGIVGLGAGVRYIAETGVERIGEEKYGLIKMLIDGIKDIPRVRLYSAYEKHRNSGIVAMNLDGIDSAELSHMLDRDYGICTRAGLHCAPGAHRILGTLQTGAVRFSAGFFNTEVEIINTIKAIETISYKKS